jgi:hypothetical protein
LAYGLFLLWTIGLMTAPASISWHSRTLLFFEPKPESTYAEHKRAWRAELLDAFADGSWCLAPDIDEHLVYRNYETTPLDGLIAAMEEEGAEALHCTMLDMYADAPLAEHCFAGGELIQAFPLTDGPDSYWLLPAPKRYRASYPTPKLFAYGGMRDRVFYRTDRQPSRLKAAILRRLARLDGSMHPGPLRSVGAALARRLARPHMSRDPFVCSKLTLLRWQRGQQFSGGSHSVRTALTLSSRSAALLHYKFAGGVGSVKYNVARGQHTDGSVLYRRILDRADALQTSPVYSGTLRYESSASLGWVLR